MLFNAWFWSSELNGEKLAWFELLKSPATRVSGRGVQILIPGML